MAAEPGLTLPICTADARSASPERMQLLASWAASEYTKPGKHTRQKTWTEG